MIKNKRKTTERNSTPIYSRPSPSPPPHPIPEFKLIDKVTYIMDELIRIPGTNIRFGLDPLLGLIPWAGDMVGALISGVTVLVMVRYGVSGKVLLLMTGNIIFDALAGSIPVIGDLFDFIYKTNRRNLKLLRKHLEEKNYF